MRIHDKLSRAPELVQRNRAKEQVNGLGERDRYFAHTSAADLGPLRRRLARAGGLPLWAEPSPDTAVELHGFPCSAFARGQRHVDRLRRRTRAVGRQAAIAVVRRARSRCQHCEPRRCALASRRATRRTSLDPRAHPLRREEPSRRAIRLYRPATDRRRGPYAPAATR